MPRPDPARLAQMGMSPTPEQVNKKRQALFELYQAALEEIANGEGDPKTIALEALAVPHN